MRINYNGGYYDGSVNYLNKPDGYGQFSDYVELYNGGEDFDFIIRLLKLKKYKISIIFSTYFKYRQTDGLSKKTEFYESHFKATKKHIDFLHEEFLAMNPYSEFEQRFYENPCYETCIEWSGTFLPLEKIVAEKRDILESLKLVSLRKKPLNSYNKQQFLVIGEQEIDAIQVLGKDFDVLFLEAISIFCYEKDIPMVINKDIWEKVKDMTGWKRMIYLLENYACFESKTGREFPGWEKSFDIIKNSLDQTDVLKKQIININQSKRRADFKETLRVNFVLHLDCNLNCEYCCAASKENKHLSDDEMYKRFDKALSFVEQKYGLVKVCLLGGEPTIWSDYFVEKVLNRLSKYRTFEVFTNGANKNSLFYKCDKVEFKYHITDWELNPEKLLRKNLKKNEIAQIVITTKNIHLLPELIKKKEYSRTTHISFCKGSPDKSLDIRGDDFKNYCNLVKNKGRLQTFCPNGRVIEIDCTSMTGRWCCLSNKAMPLDEIKYTEDTCNGCELIFQKQIFEKQKIVH